MKEILRDFYENGQPRNIIPYKNGFKHGVAYWYNESGENMTKTKYKKGKKHSSFYSVQ